MKQPPKADDADESDAVRKHLFRCWLLGRSIGETRLAVRRTCGTDLGFERVREAFVTFSEKFA